MDVIVVPVLDYRYYRARIIQTLQFIVPANKKVLFVGSLDGTILASLLPFVGVGVEENVTLVDQAAKKYPKLKFIYQNGAVKLTGKFDFIILYGSLGQSKNLVLLLTQLQKLCHPGTRIVVYQHNHLWQWAISFAEKMGWKRQENTQNWLSVADLSVYLAACGFESTRIFRRTLLPLFAFGLGPVVNALGTLIPFFDFAKLDQYILARPLPELFPTSVKPLGLTICITVRNEKENIEPIVKALPVVCRGQEILFVEGHSTDGTREEIERVAKKYHRKNVRVIDQPGYGQGDAIRVGFKDAKGDIIILYEGDQTSNASDLPYFYEAMRRGRFEFIEGSRFVYPLTSEAMPLTNKFGNIFFAKWFSSFLGQRTTDVLSGIKVIFKRDYDRLFAQWGFLGLDDPFGDFELLYGAARMGLRIGEIPMRYYPRTHGVSKTNVIKHGFYLVRMAMKGYLIFRSH